MGGSGTTENTYSPHLHLAVFTGSIPSVIYSYCSSTKDKTFAQVVTGGGSTAGYYYGADTSKYPRCGGVRFYDPYRAISSGARIITAMKNNV